MKYQVRVVDGPVGEESFVDLPAMEPRFDGHHTEDEVTAALMLREPLFHRREIGISRAELENMTDSSFWEVGASGRRYGRRFIIDSLEKRYVNHVDEIWEISDFYVTHLADATYLVTYTLDQHGRISRRSTIWRSDEDRWQCVYHQGTLVESAAPESVGDEALQ